MIRIKSIFVFFLLLSFPLLAQDVTNQSLTMNDIVTGASATGIFGIGFTIWKIFKRFQPVINQLLDSHSDTRKEIDSIKVQLSNLKKDK